MAVNGTETEKKREEEEKLSGTWPGLVGLVERRCRLF